MEARQKAVPNQQAALARSEIGIQINKKTMPLPARLMPTVKQTFIRDTGRAQAAEVEAVGLAHAKGLSGAGSCAGAEWAQCSLTSLRRSSNAGIKLVPDVLVSGPGRCY